MFNEQVLSGSATGGGVSHGTRFYDSKCTLVLLQPPQVHTSSLLLLLMQELTNEQYDFGVASNGITFIPRSIRMDVLNERKEEAHRLLHSVNINVILICIN
jgi:hypothetical protein